MRHYDIPYVANGPVNYYPAVPLEKMSLDEIKQKYIKTCAKANGNISVCSRCKTPCPEGKRAIQLIANTVYNDPEIPLYGGKTMIERAREENMKRRAEKEEQAKEEKPKKRKYLEGWYEMAIESDDPTKWVMETFGCSKTKAKQKIYDWRFRHPEVKENDKFLAKEKEVKEAEPIKEEPIVKAEQEKIDPIEKKLESLLKQQAEQKKAMDEYLKLYEQAKIEYEKLKHKTDVLCNALDIVNEF